MKKMSVFLLLIVMIFLSFANLTESAIKLAVTGEEKISISSFFFSDTFEDGAIDPQWQTQVITSLPQNYTEGVYETGNWGERAILRMTETEGKRGSYYAFYYDLETNYTEDFILEGITGVYQPGIEMAYSLLIAWDESWNRVACAGAWDSWSSGAKKDVIVLNGGHPILNLAGSTTWQTPDPIYQDYRATGVRIERTDDTSWAVYLDTDQDDDFFEFNPTADLEASFSASIRYVGFLFFQDADYSDNYSYPWADEFKFQTALHLSKRASLSLDGIEEEKMSASSFSFSDTFEDGAIDPQWQTQVITSLPQNYTEGVYETGNWGERAILRMTETEGIRGSYYAFYYDLETNYTGDFTLEGITGIYQPGTEMAYSHLTAWDESWNRVACAGAWDSWSSGAKKDAIVLNGGHLGFNPVGSTTWQTPDPIYQDYRATGVRIERTNDTSWAVYLDTDQDDEFFEFNDTADLEASFSASIRYVGFLFFQDADYSDPISYPWADEFKFQTDLNLTTTTTTTTTTTSQTDWTFPLRTSIALEVVFMGFIISISVIIVLRRNIHKLKKV
ncbi:MAG: hypothetical protein ACFFC7_03565 [Candidatus Hermodarchaeota archaeon]